MDAVHRLILPPHLVDDQIYQSSYLSNVVKQWLDEQGIVYELVKKNIVSFWEDHAEHIIGNSPAVPRYWIGYQDNTFLVGHMEISFEQTSDAALFRLRWL